MADLDVLLAGHVEMEKKQIKLELRVYTLNMGKVHSCPALCGCNEYSLTTKVFGVLWCTYQT